MVAAIERNGGKAIAHTGSVASWDDTKDMIDTAVSQFGTLTGVVNNAGIVRDAVITKMTEADWDAVIAVHLKGPFAVTKHACYYWRSQVKAGVAVACRIVNTTSGAGLWGNVGQCAYGAAKAAITNLTVVTAMEMKRYGVSVNAISPLALTRISEGFFQQRSGDPALDPARSSPVVAWLQSEEAGWLTGQILRVSGNALTRVEGFTDDGSRYHAADGEKLTYSEIGDAVSWLWRTQPRGLAGPLPSV